ncbi:MAG TPA: hypothetical protein VGH74_12495, partial [Planctomycetaceae bacterium]
RRFDAPSRTTESRQGLSAPTRWLFFLAILFALSGGVAALADKGARNVALAWAAQISQRLGRGTSTQAEQTLGPGEFVDAESGLAETSPAGVSPSDAPKSNSSEPVDLARPTALPTGLAMPAPDRHGVVRLSSAGPYRACDITVVGELAIVGAAGTRPRILIDEQPVKLCAETLRLKNVSVEIRPGITASPPKSKALLRGQSQELIVDDCVFDGGGGRLLAEAAESKQDASQPVMAPPTGPASIAWKLLDPAEQRGGRATIHNTRFTGDGPSLYLAHAVRAVEFNNVLKIGPGPLIQLAGVPAEKTQVALRLIHTTCRASGALVRWIVVPEQPPRGQVVVEAGDCVFEIVAPRAALFELAGDKASPEWLRSLRMTGEGSLTRPGLEVAAWVSTLDGRVTPLDSSAIEVEGLFSGAFRFAGESDKLPADSEVHDSEAPRRSSESPGINAAALPDG